MEAVRTTRLPLLIVLAALTSSCQQVAYEVDVNKKTHTRQVRGVLDVRADHALYRINDHAFEYDLRPIGNALIHSGAQSAKTLKPGEIITPFILFKPGPSTAAAHKTRFGGVISRPKKTMSLEDMKPKAPPANSTLRFQEINGRRWIVQSVFKDSGNKVIQSEEWGSIIDDFAVTFWMHMDDLAPLDLPLRNGEVQRLRALVRGFRYSP
jgi:hypothetical protein